MQIGRFLTAADQATPWRARIPAVHYKDIAMCGIFRPACCHIQVDPEKGTWADIDKLAKKYDLMVEFMVNHISPASQEFQDFLSNGPDSEYWPMFIHWNQFWEGGELPGLQDILNHMHPVRLTSLCIHLLEVGSTQWMYRTLLLLHHCVGLLARAGPPWHMTCYVGSPALITSLVSAEGRQSISHCCGQGILSLREWQEKG